MLLLLLSPSSKGYRFVASNTDETQYLVCCINRSDPNLGRFPYVCSSKLVLASLNGKVQGARVHYPPRALIRHNSPNSRALGDRSRRTRNDFWSLSRAILTRNNSENSFVPFKNRLKWKWPLSANLFVVGKVKVNRRSSRPPCPPLFHFPLPSSFSLFIFLSPAFPSLTSVYNMASVWANFHVLPEFLPYKQDRQLRRPT